MTHTYQEGDEPVTGTGYHLVRFLGRGGFGEVWEAKAPGGTAVAMKFIRLGGAEGRKEFRALQLVKRIRHPNLMPIGAFWLKSDDGNVLNEALEDQASLPAGDTAATSPLQQTLAVPPPSPIAKPAELVIVMGLGDKSLMDRLEECRAEGLPGIPREELLPYLEDAAEAIDFLNRPVHRRDSTSLANVAIQHCDIKPHNLMIVGGAVQVCDFGLARILGADRSTSAAASIAYAAPECLETGNPSASTDQYSLAITYYELATGVLPFRVQTVASVMDAKRHGTLDLSQAPAQEGAVLRRATASDPKQRFASAVEMINALRQATAAGEGRRGGRRGKPWVLAMSALAAVLLLGAFGAWWRWGHVPETIQVGPSVDKGLVSPTPSRPTVTENPAQAAAAAAMEQAAALAAGEQWQPAADEYTKALEQAPSTAAYVGRAHCYLKLVQYDRALADFEQAQKLTPDSRDVTAGLLQAYLGRGTARLEQGQYDLAIADFTPAASLDPHDPRIFSRRGAAWLRKDEWVKAVADFTTAIGISPDPRDYVSRGRAYLTLDKTGEAVGDFTRAVQLDPENAQAHFLLGTCYSKKEQEEQAIADLSEAIKIAKRRPDPSFALADAYFLRGSCALVLMRPDPAVSDFTEALHLGPKDAEAQIHELRASAYEVKHEADLARADHQLAVWLAELKAKPRDAEIARRIAHLLATFPQAELRDGRRALELATQASELTSGKNAACLDTLAAAYAEQGRFKEAVDYATQAVGLASDPKTSAEYRSHQEKFQAGKPLRE